MGVTDWLDARDGETVAGAWAALAAEGIEVGRPLWPITPHGCARFAAAFLGWPLERLTWLAAGEDDLPPPSFDVRRTVSRCFLEHALDWSGDCFETWQLRELVDGARGVQHVMMGLVRDDGTREGGGGSATVVRVFDRSAGTAASIRVGSQSVWTIGALDLAALDLFDHRVPFLIAWKYDPDHVRALLAQVASELDAHFDVSTTWPGRTLDERDVATGVRMIEKRFESGDHAIEFVEHHRRSDESHTVSLRATILGLPWGHELRAQMREDGSGMECDLRFRLPLAQGDAALARLASIPGVALTP